ncbi:hypothetical protein CEXT_313371 [Caerostris extrusa]|uniref:Uncharacterized protein n=1 Tax=Caerostris extrusa TaxID=172846 RepID=A0AAV4Y899_CAEEX|nr:hypothetical protein CEXT_313371 [Caerostris extrusa]
MRRGPALSRPLTTPEKDLPEARANFTYGNREHKFSLDQSSDCAEMFTLSRAWIEPELVLSVSVSEVGACFLEVLSGVVSGPERAEPRLIRIFFVHCGSLYRCLTKKYVLPGQTQSSGEFLSQRQLSVLRTTPPHTAAQVHSVRKRSFVFQR